MFYSYSYKTTWPKSTNFHQEINAIALALPQTALYIRSSKQIVTILDQEFAKGKCFFPLRRVLQKMFNISEVIMDFLHVAINVKLMSQWHYQ